MTSTVGKVRVRLRITERDTASAAALQAAVEQRLLRGVLDALEAAIHARLGHEAIVRVRRLPLRWRLAGAELADGAIHRQLGTELAEGLLAEASPALPPAGASAAHRTAARALRPAAGTSIVAFVDDVHAIAVALAERGEGAEPAFHHPARTVPELWRLVAEGGPARVSAVSELLRGYGATAALAGAPIGALDPRAARMPVAPATSPAATAQTAGASPHADAAVAVADIAATISAAAMATAQLARGRVDVDTDAATVAATATHIAGAFFLLGRVMELELAEHLWCAGIAEGDHVARAIAMLVPPEYAIDPALAVIAGAADFASAPTPELAAWAGAEVAGKTRHALGLWLARRGVGLAADALGERLDALAADLNPAASASTVIASAATLCAVVCERLGVPWRADTVRALVTRDGAITVTADEIRVELALATVEVDVRRAGLDFDPGWIPWLARTVRIVFAARAADVG